MRSGRTPTAGIPVLCIAVCMALWACEPAPVAGTAPSVGATDFGYRKALLDKAQQLAEEEIARLAATELVYRNKTVRQETVIPIVGSHVGVIIKMYREFTGYEIVDVLRTDSMLYPVELIVRYDFDVMSTEIRSIGMSDARAITDKDHEFDVLWKGEFTQRYRCDDDGNPLEEPPELPRVSFYERQINSDPAEETGEAAIQMVPPPVSPTLR